MKITLNETSELLTKAPAMRLEEGNRSLLADVQPAMPANCFRLKADISALKQ
jgi:hypothetical protein